jgi:hypothetical protein
MSLATGPERGFILLFVFLSTHLHLFLFTFSFTRMQSHRSPDPVLLSPFMYVYDRLSPSRPRFPTHVCCTVSIFMHFVQSITDSGYQST